MKKRIAVIGGGWASEREISLKSARAVFDALDRGKYDVSYYEIDRDLDLLFREREKIDLAFPLLHGKKGEDGAIQGFLKILGIPFVGSDILASSLAMNKKFSKRLFKESGIDVPDAVFLEKGRDFSVSEIINKLGIPVVVKPLSEGSSFGVSICRDEREIKEGIQDAFRFDEEVLIEEYIDGKEITAPVIGKKELEVLPLVEIVPKEGFFSFEAKYKPGMAEEICPARISPEQEKKAKDVAKKAFRALGCNVWARVDMILKEEKVYVLEVNTIPGMTETSLFPLSAKKAGMSFSELLDRLISLSLE